MFSGAVGWLIAPSCQAIPCRGREDGIDTTTGEQAWHFSGQIPIPLLAEKVEEAARTYIVDGGNLTQASRDLNVHRNTMLYKLDRASKVIAQDLRDPETQFSLWLAMKLDLLAKTADSASRTIASG